ncbi:MAG: MATE family efflux transporter [Paludibacteraceae bacterium]|nr:MATE family efflux transporter [Paludibacteraceae bacterium]
MSLREYIPFYRRNLKVAGPVMLTQLGAAMAGIIDSIMVGHFGTTELAAVSFANSIFFTAMVFSFGALMGITPLVGYAFVQNDNTRVGSLFRSGLLFSVGLSLSMVAILVAVYFALPYMGQDPDVIRVATPYYILATISTLPFLLAHYAKQFLEGLGNTFVAMVVAISLNIINIPLNWIFIFGHLGAPAMGATGAGLATLIIRILQPICLFLILLLAPKWKQYIFLGKCSLRKAWEVTKLGLPIGLQQTMEILAFTGSVTLVGWISKEAVAAHQIANHISDLTFMVSMGIGAGTTIRVAHQYGAGHMHDMRMAARASVHLSLLWSVLCAAVIISCSRIIPMAFTSDQQVIDIASTLLIFCGLFQISDALQCIGGSMLRGISDVRIPAIIAFVAYILIAIPLGYILMFPVGLGAAGMWIAFIVGLSLAAIFLQARFWHLAKKL